MAQLIESEPNQPPARVRLTGRALNTILARAPWLWPLLRRPVTAFFDARAAGWDERTGARQPAHLAALAVAVTKVGDDPERALDVGTGTGEAALFLAREFPRASVRGVDIAPEMIRRARGKIGLDPEGRVAFRVADAARLPFDDGWFDLVAQVNMPPFFGEIARALRPGGYAIVVASSGARTPFFTPERVLDRGFRRHGLVRTSAGEIEGGSYFVARKEPGRL